jgi:hypothetical protein
MFSEIAPEELAATLDRVAMDILAEARVEHPPVDAFHVARALGITVALDDRQPVRARFVRLKGLPGGSPRATILLRPEPRRERQHWAVAHEVGEHAAWRVFQILAIDPRETSPMARETVANHLAGRLLLPEPWFALRAKQCGWDLLRLKTAFPTASHELIARRMLDFAPWVIVSIFDQQQVSLRRSNLPGRVPPLSPREKQCWHVVHAHNRPHASEDGVIQGWPVHEPAWQREILRTAVDEVEE